MTLYQRFDLFSSDTLIQMYHDLRKITVSRMDNEDLEIVTQILIQRKVIKE